MDNSTTSTDPVSEADLDTLERIKNLAIVGAAITEESNEATFQTDFFLAKEALNRFRDGIEKLHSRVALDSVSKKGMDNLIAHLDTLIDQKMQGSV